MNHFNGFRAKSPGFRRFFRMRPGLSLFLPPAFQKIPAEITEDCHPVFFKTFHIFPVDFVNHLLRCMPHQADQTVLVDPDAKCPSSKRVAGCVRLAVFYSRRFHCLDPYPALEQFRGESVAIFHGKQILAGSFTLHVFKNFSDCLGYGDAPFAVAVFQLIFLHIPNN